MPTRTSIIALHAVLEIVVAKEIIQQANLLDSSREGSSCRRFGDADMKGLEEIGMSA
jgi:hypothetical protein